MLAASDQPGDDLRNTTLFALVGVGHQALHVWLQHWQKGIVEVAEQSLEGQEEEIRFVFLFG